MNKLFRSSKARLLLLLATVPVITVLAALVYMVGMEHLEHDPRNFWDSLRWSVETFTTTGYGGDSEWDSPLMIIYVGAVQFAGVFLVFLVFPIYLIPFLEERFERRLPKSVEPLSDHVVIYGYGPAVDSLLDQLEAAGTKAVVIEEDETMARRLFDRGVRVVYSRLEDGAFEGARLKSARALIANTRDDRDAAVILAARQSSFSGDIMALVEEPMHRRPMVLAGASVVFTPRHMLGAALAARASERISPRIAGVQHIGRLHVVQPRIFPDSPLAGKTLGEAEVGRHTGVSVIGQWVAGELRVPSKASSRIEPNGMLVIVGTEENLSRFNEVFGSGAPIRRTGPFVVAGYGEVGRKVVQLLTDAGEEVIVIDRQPAEGVDIVMDILDPRVFDSFDHEQSQGLILAVDSDSATVFAAVIAKDMAPHLPVIARVNEAVNIERIYQAGADFALSMSQVSGQILASRLLGEEAVSIDTQLKVRKLVCPRLANKRLGALNLRERTGTTVVAVERGDQVETGIGPDFVFQAEDRLYVCGSGESVQRFASQFS